MKKLDKTIVFVSIIILIIAGIGTALIPTSKPHLSHLEKDDEDTHRTAIIEENNITENDSANEDTLTLGQSIINTRIDILKERKFVLFRQIRINILEKIKELI